MKPWLRYLRNAALILTTLLAGLKIWDLVTRPHAQLRADVEYGAFILPPQLSAVFGRLDQFTDEDSLSRDIDLPRLIGDRASTETKRAAEEAVYRVARVLFRNLPTSLPFEFADLHGIWLVTVRNDGKLPVADAAITLPNAKYVSIQRAGQPLVSTESGPVVSIGIVRPRETISIYAWAQYQPSRYTAGDVILSHAAGVGTVQVRAPVGAVGQWAEDAWEFSGFLILWIAVGGLLLILQLLSRESKSNTSDSGSSPGDAPKA